MSVIPQIQRGHQGRYQLVNYLMKIKVSFQAKFLYFRPPDKDAPSQQVKCELTKIRELESLGYNDANKNQHVLRQSQGSLETSVSILAHLQRVEDDYVDQLREMGFKLDEELLRLALRLSKNDLGCAITALTKEVDDHNEVSQWGRID